MFALRAARVAVRRPSRARIAQSIPSSAIVPLSTVTAGARRSRAAAPSLNAATARASTEDDGDWIVLGCDSDGHGAICAIEGPRRGVVRTIRVVDNPTSSVMVNGRARVRLDPEAMRVAVAALNVKRGTRIYLEEGGVEFGFSAQTAFVQGYNFGLWRGILAAQEFDIKVVKPQAWKAALGLKFKGSTKDDSIAMAKALFPEVAHELSRKRDHGRAESLLIAAYGHVANGAAAAADDDALCARVRDVLADRGLVRDDGAPLPYFGPYFGMTGDELKRELRARALKVSGTKTELILRLEGDDVARSRADARRERATA